MIRQLVQHLGGTPADQATVLTADPLDVVLRMEEIWDLANLLNAPAPGPAGRARRGAFAQGQFAGAPVSGSPAWDHLIYAYVIENTRAAQILARVVRLFRSGEALGIPSAATQRWLDATEVLLLAAPNPFAPWLSTSAVRPDAEGVRRNAYFRLFGMDLAHGTDANAPYVFDKAEASNTNFVRLFEDLLAELWQAIENVRNLLAGNKTDDDRIYRLAEQLGYMLRTRRQNSMLGREELAATTAMGWIDLTLASDTPVVVDLRAQAASPADRLRIIGERVGLPPHSRSNSFFSMAVEISLLLRALEAGWVTGNGQAWLLYQTAVPPGGGGLPPGVQPLGAEVRRVITEWSAASGRDLKVQKLPVMTTSTPALARR